MHLSSTTLENLADSMPNGFRFYHLGEVAADRDPPPSSPKTLAGVAFAIQGEIIGTIIFVFDLNLEISTYAEMGNIIVSQMATDLWNRKELAVSISPPKFLNGETLLPWLNQAHLVRTYLHRHQGVTIPVKALISITEKSGHA